MLHINPFLSPILFIFTNKKNKFQILKILLINQDKYNSIIFDGHENAQININKNVGNVMYYKNYILFMQYPYNQLYVYQTSFSVNQNVFFKYKSSQVTANQVQQVFSEYSTNIVIIQSLIDGSLKQFSNFYYFNQHQIKQFFIQKSHGHLVLSLLILQKILIYICQQIQVRLDLLLLQMYKPVNQQIQDKQSLIKYQDLRIFFQLWQLMALIVKQQQIKIQKTQKIQLKGCKGIQFRQYGKNNKIITYYQFHKICLRYLTNKVFKLLNTIFLLLIQLKIKNKQSFFNNNKQLSIQQTLKKMKLYQLIHSKYIANTNNLILIIRMI
ncbi:hypothetical protein TTHERM_000768551 (macronuclear) [Tetrahymena thermophila SB210]|uniref:Uncharacterized protein n=1 Tax=Tetrahymena thermophila (strain SB210) TaxID=312017 RepID=W7X6C6_TETTS|nr:hypothetical protein TTHERM_000768551 [Tetrahymena thermophila SB210]EWS74930.1 hypothetical protein TTHERM_000768551 [Tetrahymena thermophila SB210]|eukprot:XP_012652519.1 hypothetical protein TTHERM_000768551 [Tetrahymena thermophila SB210]